MKKPDREKIERALNNTATAEEAREVIGWFATKEGSIHLSTLMDEDMVQIVPGSEEAYIDHPIPSDEMYQQIMKAMRWQKKKRFLFKVAAILIPFLLLTGQFWYIDKQIDLFADTGYEDVYVPKGERIQLVFQDGSKAILNSGSHIRYPKKFAFAERKVTLEGEAFFDIAPNKSRPFIVDLKEINVEVLGTTFDAKAYPTDSTISVTLETGKIRLASRSNTTYLKPGEKATYNKKTGHYNISIPEDITRNSVWKENLIIFENTSLSEVVQTLSRWYDVEFDITDPAVLRYTYTITFSKKELNVILKEIEKISPVRFKHEKNKINVFLKK